MRLGPGGAAWPRDAASCAPQGGRRGGMAAPSSQPRVQRALGEVRQQGRQQGQRRHRQQGQQGLGPVDSAAASTQDRLARNRKLLAIID